MLLAALLITERVENRKCGWSETQREPDRRRRFLIREFEPLLQKRGHLVLLTWLRLETDKQTQIHHTRSPWSPRDPPALSSRLPSVVATIDRVCRTEHAGVSWQFMTSADLQSQHRLYNLDM